MKLRKIVRGFSLVEAIIMIGVFVLLASLELVTLTAYRRQADLNNSTKTIVALLREAQSRAMSQASSTPWGVHFENSTNTAPFYSLFFSAFSTSTRIGYYRLPATVKYAPTTIPIGTSKEIIFSSLRGLPSVSTSITLTLAQNSFRSSTIVVASSGVVSY